MPGTVLVSVRGWVREVKGVCLTNRIMPVICCQRGDGEVSSIGESLLQMRDDLCKSISDWERFPKRQP